MLIFKEKNRAKSRTVLIEIVLTEESLYQNICSVRVPARCRISGPRLCCWWWSWTSRLGAFYNRSYSRSSVLYVSTYTGAGKRWIKQKFALISENLVCSSSYAKFPYKFLAKLLTSNSLDWKRAEQPTFFLCLYPKLLNGNGNKKIGCSRRLSMFHIKVQEVL